MKKLTIQTHLIGLLSQKPELFIQLREIDHLVIIKLPQFITVSKHQTGIFIVSENYEEAIFQTAKLFYKNMDNQLKYYLKKE